MQEARPVLKTLDRRGPLPRLQKVFLSCSRCKIRITKSVRALDDPSVISIADGKPYLPSGLFLVSQSEDEIIHQPGEYILNLADLQNTKRHSNRSRLRGCCGLDGCNGPNIVCINGHEVGTERSDCWMPHFIAISPSAVTASHEHEIA